MKPVKRALSAETRAKISLAQKNHWARVRATKGSTPSAECAVPSSSPEPSPRNRSQGSTSPESNIGPSAPTYRSIAFKVLSEAQRPISMQEACKAAEPLIEQMNAKGKTPMLSFKAKFYVAAKKGEISRIGDMFALPPHALEAGPQTVPLVTKAETRPQVWRHRIATALKSLWAKRSSPERNEWRRRISTALKSLWVQRRAEITRSMSLGDYQK